MDYPSINRSEEYNEIIERLYHQKDQDLEISLFATIRDVLLFAAVLGFAENNRKPVKKRGEPIRMSVFENVKADETIFLLALAETKDYEILKHDPENMKRCITTFEELANGGLEIIYDWVNFRYPTMTIDQAIMAGLEDAGYIGKNSDTLDNESLKKILMAD